MNQTKQQEEGIENGESLQEQQSADCGTKAEMKKKNKQPNKKKKKKSKKKDKKVEDIISEVREPSNEETETEEEDLWMPPEDVYLHTTCLATLANMANHVHRLSAYASQRLVSLFDMLSRKYDKLADRRDNKLHVAKENSIEGNNFVEHVQFLLFLLSSSA